MPMEASVSASPPTSGPSGPITTRSTFSTSASLAMPITSSMDTSRRQASAAMPALPGAHSSSGGCGERASARTIACSRPPAPTTRTFTSERSDELVDGDSRQRLVAPGAARAQLERDARHRALVGRLDDRDEVDVPERRPLRLDGGAELLDLLVDLGDALRVVLDRLHAVGGE